MTVDVPIIDLGGRNDAVPSQRVTEAIADAGQRFGFFQVVNHGISASQVAGVFNATHTFFELSSGEKRKLLRTKENTRGYYDRELTKNARDRKEVLDISQVPHPDLGDDDPLNLQSVDGTNRWPNLPGFRDTMLDWLTACEGLSNWLLAAFCLGLDEPADRLSEAFAPGHSSFVRLNHYPLGDPLSPDEADDVTPLGDMALHHHTDAGALTVLLQDDVGGLQVSHTDGGAEAWIDVEPIDGALVINTGDMMQVWSNDRYRAGLHRVAPVTDRPRFSLPYFFNPSYDTDYSPLPGSIGAGETAAYDTINWGEFRQARADGDYADYGTEVQIAHFRHTPAK